MQYSTKNVTNKTDCISEVEGSSFALVSEYPASFSSVLPADVDIRKWWPDYMLLSARSSRGDDCARTTRRLLSIHLNTYTTIQVDVFEKVITLPGRSEVSLAATTPCRLQLCAVLRSLASKLSGHSLRHIRSRPLPATSFPVVLYNSV